MAAIESRARVGLVLLATVLAGASCSAPEPATRAAGGAESVVAVPTPVAATSTPPATTPPIDVLSAMPAEAKQHTVKGAEAFARYFFETASTLNTRPIPGALSKLCTPDYTLCSSREKNTSWLASNNYHTSGREHDVIDAAAIADTPELTAIQVTMALQQLSTRLLDSAGKDVDQWTTRELIGLRLTLVWRGDRWLAAKSVKVS